MNEKKKEILFLIIGTGWSFFGLYGVILFNQYVMMQLPIGLRMAAMIIEYWLIMSVPIIAAVVCRDKLSDYWSTDRIGRQILTGVIIGLAMSVVLTLVPHFAGFGEYVDNGKRYTYLWQFIYEFFYCILAIGLAEEFIFRGFIYNKIKNICCDEIAAVVGSSVLFGAFHIFGGNIVQMIMTAFIGAFFCVCRIKIKGCTLLSLVIAHGLYDALITVWVSVLLR